MRYFGVELDAVGGLALNMKCRDLDGIGFSDNFEGFRNGNNRITVRHPNLRKRRNCIQQRRVRMVRKHGPTVFAVFGGFDFAAECMGQQLCAVANPQQRHFAPKKAHVDAGRAFVAYGIGASRKDNSLYIRRNFGDFIEGMNFAVNIQFADASSDELGELRTEIKNQNLFGHRRVSKVQR